ncbi:glycosyltransferase family 9 protein [Luteolibacter sp. AS25]|uniref:glycosyltransferase family 9 protein n=1 Tax=Luteolibacter sp. AS25 TaxID=3135776 RepID=UPI00398B4658
MYDKNGILIATPLRWDEACFSVPAIRALCSSGLAGGLLCPAEQEEFWETVCPLPITIYPENATISKLLKIIGAGWEASLVWENERAAKAFAKLKIQKRLGPSDSPISKYLTHPIETAEKSVEHRVHFYLNTCEKMGLPVKKPEYFLPANLGQKQQSNTVLLCPGSDFGISYEWPLEKWQELAIKLLDQGKKLTVACLIGGRGQGKALADKLGDRVGFFEASPLAGTLPLLASHALVISADSSLPHLAAHAGTTCLTLFGPNEPLWKRPLGTRHVVAKKAVECSPCFSEKCLLDQRCQTELDVNTVFKAIPGLEGSAFDQHP